MLVNFSYINGQKISMFEKDAKGMLEVMEMSGKIPGAMNPEDIPTAIKLIEEASSISQQQPETANDAKAKDNSVSFKNRAFPLLELLNMAVEKNQSIIWEYE
ncbi:DUF1840 family protein [Cocleimonas sp. KMM 6892]|uniref:DUF1840 family protein n=1 Tax=unclassified Cocleimonas TaxID=2639732 RepID=UPI002DB91C67|nr:MULTISPECIES: DUF1840 family protein [unclassified Cocleimonas]MEB8431816.1 DUF1840 family protein [Cocleimonas sp. KMM 6892]MEC4715098.1 DUF1840 family protein [Cocleimonas sp. KMM 6895]MEC4744088.1 DUF1840 family protein [Cocleimonas sp. KMM 6896]